MIVSSMSCIEMYDNLMADRPKIEIKIEYLRSKAIKELKKARKFPAVVTYKYKIPATLNEHIIYFYAESRYSVNKPEANSFFSIFDKSQRYIIKPNKSIHKSEGDYLLIKCVDVYTSHFLDRYNERFLKDNTLDKNEIAGLFLARNKHVYNFQMNKDINRNYEKYGPAGRFGFRIRDGYCFACIDQCGCLCKQEYTGAVVPKSVATFYKTYTNDSDMHDSQTKAIKEMEDARRKFMREEMDLEECKKMIAALNRL